MQFRHLTFDEIDSTNFGIKRAIDASQTEGLVVRAARQTEGYGRQGRTWVSPEGGLYLSILLRPSVRIAVLPTLSLAVAVGLCRAFRALLPAEGYDRLCIKWPNDVIVAPLKSNAGEGERLAAPPLPAHLQRVQKLCGISTEAYRGAVCLGLGVNVFRPDRLQAVEGKNDPVYLADLGFEGDLDQVADVVLRDMSRAYEQWRDVGFAAFAREFDGLMAYRGETVEIRDMAGKVCERGMLQGIDEGGRLRLDQNGAQSFISSGELCPSGR